MRKRLVIGDLHGIGTWKDIYESECPDDVIFLGDYFDSFTLSPEVQKLNFDDLQEVRKNHTKGNFITIMGNHDYHYLVMSSERYSGYNDKTFGLAHSELGWLLDSNQLPVVYIDYINKIIFSHAGVSQKWFDEHVGTTLDGINNASLESLKFTYKDGGDWYGSSQYSSPIWIRPEGLYYHSYRDEFLTTWNQIFGHTHQKEPSDVIIDDAYFMNLDCLKNGWYLIQLLDDEGKLIENQLKQLIY